MQLLLAMANLILGSGGILVLSRTPPWPGILLGMALLCAGFGTAAVLLQSYREFSRDQEVIYYLGGGIGLLASAILAVFGVYSLAFVTDSDETLVSTICVIAGVANCAVNAIAFRTLARASRNM